MAKAKINPNELLAAVEENMFGLGNAGFCTHCGAEALGVEPDARNYECEVCGKTEVFGAEELMIMGYC
jgi:hypothetical protein